LRAMLLLHDSEEHLVGARLRAMLLLHDSQEHRAQARSYHKLVAERAGGQWFPGGSTTRKASSPSASRARSDVPGGASRATRRIWPAASNTIA